MIQKFESAEASRQLLLSWGFGGKTFSPKELNYEDDPLYDTVTIGAAGQVSANTTQFFRDIANKNIAQTNMTRNNELPSPEMFSVQSIGIYFNPNINPIDFQAITQNLGFQFKVGRKPVLTGPIWEYAAGAGAFYSGTQTATGFSQNGMPTRQSMKKLQVPILIESGVYFGAYFDGTPQTLQTAPAPGLTCTVILRGIYIKGVQ